MSFKVSTFANIITNPLNIHNFLVDIPDVDLCIIVSASSFPSEKLRKIILYFQGEQVRYPTIPSNDGVWKIKIPENDDGKVRASLDALKSANYNQKTGYFTPNLWKNVTVTARDLSLNPVFQTIMHGVWLVGRDQVDLQNSDPTKNWEWDYEFCYTWLQDVDLGNVAVSAPV